MRKILAALALTVVFASCKKESAINPGPVPGKKLTHSTYIYNGGITETEAITYDAQGRIMTYVDDDRSYSFSYVSATKLVVTAKKISDNSFHRSFECTLNSNGAITEMLFKQQNGDLYYKYEYTYNADNYMTGVKGFLPSGPDYEIEADIVNGDIVNTRHFNNGVPNRTGHYTYEGNQKNSLPYSLSNYWPSYTLFGKPVAHLLTEYKSINPAGVMTWHQKTSYEFDADNKVTKAITQYVHQGTASVATYQYQ